MSNIALIYVVIIMSSFFNYTYLDVACHLFMLRSHSLQQFTGKVSTAAALDPTLAPQTSNMAISPHQG